MPVNWTSGKAKLAKSKFRKRPKKTWKDSNNDFRKKSFPSRRYPMAKKLVQRSESAKRHARNDDSEGRESKRERTKSTEIDENADTRSAGLLQDGHSTSVHPTSTSNHQKIDIARKKRALLALTDWAGLHIPSGSALGPHKTPAPHSARHRGENRATRVTPSKQAAVPNHAIETESPSHQRGFRRNSNIRSSYHFSLSPSSHDPIVSPTPTNPRAKKTASKVDLSSSSKLGLKFDVPEADEKLEYTTRSDATDVESNRRSFTDKDESIQKALSNQPLSTSSISSKTDRADSIRPQVPPWVCRISEYLGLSPPSGISEFEKQRAIEIESQHSIPSIEHHTTPDLDLLIKPEISPRPDQHSRRDELFEGAKPGEYSLISSKGKGDEGVGKDSEDNRETPEGQKEVHQRTGNLVGGSENSLTKTTNSRILQARQQTPHRLNGNRNSDGRWRNLVAKPKNDQFDLLFQGRNDDGRIF